LFGHHEEEARKSGAKALPLVSENMDFEAQRGRVPSGKNWVRFFRPIFGFFAFPIDGPDFVHFSIWVRFAFFRGKASRKGELGAPFQGAILSWWAYRGAYPRLISYSPLGCQMLRPADERIEKRRDGRRTRRPPSFHYGVASKRHGSNMAFRPSFEHFTISVDEKGR
jgi:hypothetical protein